MNPADNVGGDGQVADNKPASAIEQLLALKMRLPTVADKRRLSPMFDETVLGVTDMPDGRVSVVYSAPYSVRVLILAPVTGFPGLLYVDNAASSTMHAEAPRWYRRGNARTVDYERFQPRNGQADMLRHDGHPWHFVTLPKPPTHPRFVGATLGKTDSRLAILSA